MREENLRLDGVSALSIRRGAHAQLVCSVVFLRSLPFDFVYLFDSVLETCRGVTATTYCYNLLARTHARGFGFGLVHRVVIVIIIVVSL